MKERKKERKIANKEGNIAKGRKEKRTDIEEGTVELLRNKRKKERLQIRKERSRKKENKRKWISKNKRWN